MTHPNGYGRGRIVTVTPNPALDLTYQIEKMRPGDSHRVGAPLSQAGGKGINVARVVYQMGYPALAIAPVGGENGSRFRAELKASGIEHRLVPVAAETRRTIAMVESATDRTSMFNELGLPIQPSEWEELLFTTAASLSSDPDGETSPPGVLVGSGSLPAQMPDTFYPDLVKLAHAQGIPALIDTAGTGLVKSARAGADLLKPNYFELMDAMGQTDVPSAARRLLQLGARRVLVSMGAEGMSAFAADLPGIHLKACLRHPLRGNPTGAGDAAVAAVAVTYARNENSLEVMLRRAAAWSAAAVLMPLAGGISDDYAEIEQQLIITEEPA